MKGMSGKMGFLHPIYDSLPSIRAELVFVTKDHMPAKLETYTV